MPSTEQVAVRDTKIPKTLGSWPWGGRYGYRCLIQKESFFQKEGYRWRCRFRGSGGKWRKWSLTLGSRGWVGVGRNWKWGAGKKMSLQMRATAWWVSHGWRTSNVWGLHSPVGWNHRMCKGIKATRLCGKVMVTPWSPEWQEKHHLADSSHLGRRILETDFITSGIHYPTGKLRFAQRIFRDILLNTWFSCLENRAEGPSPSRCHWWGYPCGISCHTWYLRMILILLVRPSLPARSVLNPSHTSLHWTLTLVSSQKSRHC